MTEKQRTNTIIASNVNEDAGRRRAHDERQAKFWQGVKDLRYMFLSTAKDIEERCLQNLHDQIAQFDSDRVPIGDFDRPWDLITFVCGFNPEYVYTGVVDEGYDQEERCPIRNICGMSDYIEEMSVLQSVREALIAYLVSAAALARRVNSPSYEGWVGLLSGIKFVDRYPKVCFASTDEAETFVDSVKKLSRRLWMDVEICQANKKLGH